MSKMSLEDVRNAAEELSDADQELLYLDLAMKMTDVAPEVLDAHLVLVKQRWASFAAGKAGSLSLNEALRAIDDLDG